MFVRIVSIFVACAVLCQAFSWTKTPTSQWLSRTATSSTVLGATAVVDGRTKTLNLMKERYSGRGDLASMNEENDAIIASYETFEEADDEAVHPPKVGETITGAVIEMDDNGALLAIGGKMSGYLPLKEASLIPIKNVNTIFNIGDSVSGEIIGTLKGMPVLSLRSAQLIVAWEQAINYRAADTTFDAKVIEINKGGAVCAVFGLKAFLPGSHFLGTPDESLIGTTLQVKFLDVNEDEGKLVVSQRRAMADGGVTMKRGAVVGGTITGLRPYGAFMELDGGSAGLLHISQISYDRIDNLETLFTVGQRCKVMILDHDKANSRVALSTKALEPNPGDMLRNMESVFEKAEETAKKYHERLEAERVAREAAAKDIVAGLGGVGGFDSSDSDAANPMVSVADSIESILASIVTSTEGKQN